MLLPFWLSKILRRMVANLPDSSEAKRVIPVVFPVTLALVLTVVAVQVASKCQTGQLSWLALAFALVVPEIYLAQHYIHIYAFGNKVCTDVSSKPNGFTVRPSMLDSQLSAVPALSPWSSQ